MGGIMRSRSLQMTLLSLSIASLFVPNFAVAETIKTEIILTEGQVDKSDLIVTGHLQGAGEHKTDLNVNLTGENGYALSVSKGGQISNFGQIRVDGYTKLTNAKLSDINELILSNEGNALWIGKNSEGYDSTQVSINNLSVEKGNILIDEGNVEVNENLKAETSTIKILENSARLSVDGTLSASRLIVGKANSTNKYDVDVGELKADQLDVLGGADIDIGGGVVQSKVTITDGDLAVTEDFTINGTINSVVVKGGRFTVKGTLTAPYIKFHKDGRGSEATLGAVKTDSLWVENSQDQVSIGDLTVNTELVLNAGELTVGNGKITGTGRVLEGSTLNVTNDLTLTGKSLTLNGTYESEGSLTLEKDSAVFIGGSFKADEVIANDLATMVLETKNFNANKVTLEDGEIRIRETANGVNVNSVSMDGSESRIQSWAGNATVKSVEAKGNSLIELYGLNDSSVAANLRIDQMALSDGANITLDNATKFDESSVAFGTVTLGKDSVLANVNNGISQQGIEQKALTNLTFESIEGNQATIVNDEGGKISIQKMTGSNNVVKVADTTADQIIIGNNASAGLTVTSSDSAYGNSMVSVDQGVADLAGTTVLGEDSTEGMKVVIGANDMTGRVEAVYDAKGNKISQTEEVNETNRTLTAIANLPVVAWRAELNDLYKRMGDLRATPYKSGAWVRYNGGKLKWSDGDLENDFHMIQVGIDTMPTENNIRFGTAFSYTKGDADFDGGSADLDTYSLALYGTWLGDKGQYVDVIGRMASIKNDANARSLTGQGKAYDGKMDNTGLSLSAEAGWRFALPYNLFIEPQVEATYSYIDSDSFRYGDRKYELQSTDSFIARAGFMAGIQCPDNKGNVYVRASVVHDFLGETDVKVSNAHMSRTVSNDFGGTWGEFGIGANVSVSDNTYVYADVEHTTGGEIEEPWRVNFGVRYNF